MRQTSFFPSPILVHGGELRAKKRKTMRPLCSERPLHCVLKSSQQILFPNSAKIERVARCLAKKFEVKVYGLAVNYDHVHLVLKFPHRRHYIAFVREFTGALARMFGAGLWILTPFTRVLAWGRDFRYVLRYLGKNREEAAGTRAYESRKNWYARAKKKPQGP